MNSTTCLPHAPRYQGHDKSSWSGLTPGIYLDEQWPNSAEVQKHNLLRQNVMPRCIVDFLHISASAHWDASPYFAVHNLTTGVNIHKLLCPVTGIEQMPTQRTLFILQVQHC